VAKGQGRPDKYRTSSNLQGGGTGGIRKREGSRGGVFLRNAPGKEWDARSPEDTISSCNDSINTFLFENIPLDDLNIKRISITFRMRELPC
jgi:hypothetical protein